jgi:DNA-binding NarL/FixJ family response regulator
MRIMVVDDHPLTRNGVVQVINLQPELKVCCEANNAAEAMSLLGRERPDLIITDISMPGRSGVEFIKDILALHPNLPILVLTLHEESLYAERALRAGARGFLMKDTGGSKLIEAIHQVLSGQIYVSVQMLGRIVDMFSGHREANNTPTLGLLTDREFEVFKLIGQGMTSKQIAQELHLSSKTVDVHRSHVKAKLSISDVTALVSFAARWVEAQQNGNTPPPLHQ